MCGVSLVMLPDNKKHFGATSCFFPVETLIYVPGKYELRPAVKKLYQLRPKVSASRVSFASRVVNSEHDELLPAVSKELYQLHLKIWDTKCPTIGRFLHSSILLYFVHNYMYT